MKSIEENNFLFKEKFAAIRWSISLWLLIYFDWNSAGTLYRQVLEILQNLAFPQILCQFRILSNYQGNCGCLKNFKSFWLKKFIHRWGNLFPVFESRVSCFWLNHDERPWNRNIFSSNSYWWKINIFPLMRISF